MTDLLLVLVVAQLGILNIFCWLLARELQANTDAAADRETRILPKLVEQAELEVDQVNLLDDLKDRLAGSGAVEQADQEEHGDEDDYEPVGMDGERHGFHDAGRAGRG